MNPSTWITEHDDNVHNATDHKDPHHAVSVVALDFREWTARHRSRHNLVDDDLVDDVTVHHMTFASITTNATAAAAATPVCTPIIRRACLKQPPPPKPSFQLATVTATTATPTVTPSLPASTKKRGHRMVSATTTESPFWKSLDMAAFCRPIRGGPVGHNW